MSLVLSRKRKAVNILARATRAHPYARYATTALRMYNTGRAAAPFARAAISRYRKARSNRRRKLVLRRQLGERVGTGVSKAVEQEEIETALATKTLSQYPILNLTKGTSAESTSVRLRDAVNFRGIKFCINWRNYAAAPWDDPKLYCHIAIVSPKDDAGTVPTDNFFRSNGDSVTRSTDFTNARTGMDMYCLPINTDLYRVHKHKRFGLNASKEPLGREKWTEFYMPMKRQIRYKNNSDAPTGANMYLLQWCSFAQETTGSVPITAAAYINVRMVKYFREPRGT